MEYDSQDKSPKGLGGTPVAEYPKISRKRESETPLERLRDPELHGKVCAYLKDRINMSEREMSKLKPRWQVNEKKYQAYVMLSDYEKALKALSDKGEPPKAVNIVVPYSYATISTIVTYLIHTYAGRRPIFQVGTYKKESAQSSQMMEIVLQYNADRSNLVKHLFQFLLDGQLYGVGIMRCQWVQEKTIRTSWKDEAVFGSPTPQKVKVRESVLSYEGNEICSIDPYCFYPDPRVPMSEVNRKGEFVFWRDDVGRHILKDLERQGRVAYIDAIQDKSSDFLGRTGEDSNRSLRAGGSTQYSRSENERGTIQPYVEVFQGTVTIIPAELGLGDENYPVKYLFSLANKNRVIQAQPLNLDHDMHPVVVNEPYTMGYSFGQLGIADYLSPTQDTMSWLINSHMDNVRTALNNMFVVDPSRIELQDLLTPGPGKIIRAKKTAMGTDISQAIRQFQVQDVTRSHTQDLQTMMRIGDAISSITDNLRGQQDSGGRKTATEVRTSGEAAASRLAALARFISAQAITQLTMQMSMNNQQNLSDEFFVDIVGQDGLQKHIRITPDMVTGDFHYPIHDGTLPLDRVAMLDVWKEIFMGVAADQELRSKFNLIEMFKYLAELGGARDIGRFEVQVQPDAMVDAQAQQGNMIQPQGGGGSSTPGINADPSRRLM